MKRGFSKDDVRVFSPQNEHIELHRKRHGRRLDYEERTDWHELHMNGRQLPRKCVQMRKLIKQHEEKEQKSTVDEPSEGAIPTYLLDRQKQAVGKAISSAVKQKRKEKAAKYQVPLPKVKAVSDAEAFKVVSTGKSRRKGWKRMVTKVTYVGETFTRKPAKFERFIRPMGLRFRKAHVTHPELRTTFCLSITGVKKNPSSQLYTSLGVITKGTIIEVNVSELGMVTQGGKVVWAKYAQVTNHPENDGCINALLLI
ncbi:unnamed protein product [Meloidogyne enterolobii]|uniref:Uncharacterized protein n=1 Tax=Meloidogyne enterolobii TaxID=390850 RepID=A0ACB1B1I2_MELEN